MVTETSAQEEVVLLADDQSDEKLEEVVEEVKE